MDETQHFPSDTPCAICGTNTFFLSNGFHFCLECGTQREDFQEQMIEFNEEVDYRKLDKQKIRKEDVDAGAPKMSSSRMNVHSLNFILIGIVDEVIAAGAKPSLKDAMLKLWIKLLRYENIAFNKSGKKTIVKKSRKKRKASNLSEESIEDSQKFDESQIRDDGSKLEIDDPLEEEEKDYLCGKNINMLTLYSLVYLGLNSIGDEIQLGDLLRFMRENRVSFSKYHHFLPPDIKFTYVAFIRSSFNYPSKLALKKYARRLSLKLDLPKPQPPDLEKLISRYLTELQLPSYFERCISRMLSDNPPNYTHFYLPDYEAIAMSYIIVLLKMLFGLEDYTEFILSDLAEELNKEGRRLFVWRDWVKYIEYRRIFIGNETTDDDAFISHFLNTNRETGEHNSKKSYVSGQIIDDMLTSLLMKHGDAPFRSETFPPSVTPNHTKLAILLNSDTDKPIDRNLLTHDHRSDGVEYLLKRSNNLILRSYKTEIKRIRKTYKNPVYLENFTTAHVSKVLNDKVVFAVDCAADMPWGSEDAQQILNKKYVTPPSNLHISLRPKTRSSHLKTPETSTTVSKNARPTLAPRRLDLNPSYNNHYSYFWTKHYPAHDLRSITRLEKDLEDKFPQSFTWLLHECASIIESEPASLYQLIIKLEKNIIGFPKINKKKQ